MAEWTRLENEFIAKQDGKLTDAEIAAHFAAEDGTLLRTPKAVENQRLRLRATKKAQALHDEGKVIPITLPAPEKEQFIDQMVLDDDNALIIGDVHVPTQDKEFLERACNVALDWGITNIIIGGDLFNMDAFSKFVGNPRDLFDTELDHAEQFLAPICDAFANVKLFLGNHEARFFKQVLRQVSIKRFGQMVISRDNLEMSSYEWMEMTNKGHEYPVAIIHPGNHSSIPGQVARTLADRRFTTHHVVTFHEHSVARTYSSDGKRLAIAAGMTADRLRLDYVQKQIRVNPVMMQGCVLWKNGTGYQFTPEMDATAMARMYATDPARLRSAA